MPNWSPLPRHKVSAKDLLLILPSTYFARSIGYWAKEVETETCIKGIYTGTKTLNAPCYVLTSTRRFFILDVRVGDFVSQDVCVCVPFSFFLLLFCVLYFHLPSVQMTYTSRCRVMMDSRDGSFYHRLQKDIPFSLGLNPTPRKHYALHIHTQLHTTTAQPVPKRGALGQRDRKQ